MVSEFGFAEPGEAQLGSLNTILWDLRRADYFQVSGAKMTQISATVLIGK